MFSRRHVKNRDWLTHYLMLVSRGWTTTSPNVMGLWNLETIDLEAVDLEAVDLEALDLEQGCQTCGPGARCGPRADPIRPTQQILLNIGELEIL